MARCPQSVRALSRGSVPGPAAAEDPGDGFSAAPATPEPIGNGDLTSPEPFCQRLEGLTGTTTRYFCCHPIAAIIRPFQPIDARFREIKREPILLSAEWSSNRRRLLDTLRRWPRRRELAERAFAYQEWLYRPEVGNWFDARIGSEEDFFTSWCHGSAGIGLAMLDLHRRTGDPRRLEMAVRAARASAAEGFGWSHTLRHGDMGLWEMLDAIRSAAPSWDGPSRDEIDAELLTGLEQRGPVGGLAREAFPRACCPDWPAWYTGLLRMHPEQQLPSPLLLD
jgi:hypothetical protein